MKKFLSTIALALAMVLAIPAIAPQTFVVAEAAEKTTISFYSGDLFASTTLSETIGINATKKIYLNNKNSKAAYTFSSSKNSVATVSKKGVVTGKGEGTAKITVTQKYKGKKTKIGTAKITVKKAQLYGGGYWVSAQPGFISKSNPFKFDKTENVEYVNPKAKYTYDSDNKNLVISKKGVVTQVKKAGKANLIVKETYQGKTRTLGKIPVTLKEPTYNGSKKVQLNIGDTYMSDGYIGLDEYSGERIRNIEAVGKYYIYYSDKAKSDKEILAFVNSGERSSKGLKMLTDKKGNWNGELLAKSAGTQNCALVQWNYLEKKYDKVFARFQIVVKDLTKLKDFQFPWERKTCSYDDEDDKENYTYNKKKNSIEAYLYAHYEHAGNSKGGIAFYMKQVPSVFYGDYKVTSSDPKVVSATVDDDYFYDPVNSGGMDINELVSYPENRHEKGMYLNLKFHKAGKSTITVEAGGVKKSFVINVADDDDDE